MLHWSDRQEEFLRRVPIVPILSILAELSLTALSHVFTYLTTFFICFYLSH